MINPVTDHVFLQDDLNTLVEWAITWQMDFNISKGNNLQISTHHSIRNFAYKMRDKATLR